MNFTLLLSFHYKNAIQNCLLHFGFIWFLFIVCFFVANLVEIFYSVLFLCLIHLILLHIILIISIECVLRVEKTVFMSAWQPMDVKYHAKCELNALIILSKTSIMMGFCTDFSMDWQMPLRIYNDMSCILFDIGLLAVRLIDTFVIRLIDSF